MQFDTTMANPTTLQCSVPSHNAFDALIDRVDLPECTLELAETRVIVDDYLDTPTHSLRSTGSSLRLSTVGEHHFLIYREKQHSGPLLAFDRESVERLTPSEFDEQQQGNRSHPLYRQVTGIDPTAVAVTLVRRAILVSRLYRVGETRFELGLEQVVYRRETREASDRLLTLELIEGNFTVLEAIGAYLVDEFALTPVIDPPVERGLALIAAHQTADVSPQN